LRAAGVSLGLAVITIAVFARATRNGFINFDDPDYVINNPIVNRGLTIPGIIAAFTQFHAANWHPLTWISHMMDCQIYGLEPAGHHLTSVLIHTGTVIGLFLVLLQMTDALWRSAFVAAIFAIHPLRVESVAWVSERKDVLCGLLFMLTVAAYVRYTRRPPSLGGYALVMFCFALGLMCKPMIVTLPLVLLLLDYWPLQRKLSAWNLFREKLPLLALALFSCALTILAQKHAIRPVEAFPLHARLVTALLSYKTYLCQMFFPAGLAAFYPFPQAVSAFVKFYTGALLAALSFVAWEMRFKRPWLLMGWLWYLLMLLPVVGIVQVGGQAHADRYTYLPQIGIAIALTWLFTDWFEQWRLNKMVIGGIAAAIIGLLMSCSWKQVAYWRDNETLWRHALTCTTGNEVAYVNLGHELYTQGRLDEVIALYKKVIQEDPENAEFHNNLANALRQEGKLDEAVGEYAKAVSLNPFSSDSQFNLGKALVMEGNRDEAIPHFQKAVQLKPDFLPAHISLGTALVQNGKADQAAVQFQKALEINPNDAGAHLNLGLCFMQLGRMEEAKSQYEQALKINPSDLHIQNNLAWLLATCPETSLRDGSRAVTLALSADGMTGGNNPIILHTLAAALAQTGDFTNAVNTALQAAEFAEAQSNQALADQLRSESKLYRAGKPFPILKQN
jgi:Flp pilus assembly protein TadD